MDHLKSYLILLLTFTFLHKSSLKESHNLVAYLRVQILLTLGLSLRRLFWFACLVHKCLLDNELAFFVLLVCLECLNLKRKIYFKSDLRRTTRWWSYTRYSRRQQRHAYQSSSLFRFAGQRKHSHTCWIDRLSLSYHETI